MKTLYMAALLLLTVGVLPAAADRVSRNQSGTAPCPDKAWRVLFIGGERQANSWCNSKGTSKEKKKRGGKVRGWQKHKEQVDRQRTEYHERRRLREMRQQERNLKKKERQKRDKDRRIENDRRKKNDRRSYHDERKRREVKAKQGQDSKRKMYHRERIERERKQKEKIRRAKEERERRKKTP